MTSQKLFKSTLFIFLFLVVVSYFLLFSTYRDSEIDDAWTASYVWSIVHNNSTEDIVFGIPSNIQYFGHIHAYVTGFIADHFGWKKPVFHLLNLAWVLGAALAWFFVGVKVLGNKWQATLFVVLLFALEPFLGAAYKARSDAMSFCFVSWGIVAALYSRFFIATFIVSLAVEIHAISAIGYFWILAVLIHNFASGGYSLKFIRRQLLFTVVGGVAGFAVYRFMHPQPLSEIFQYLSASNVSMVDFSNVFAAHYFERKYFRFIPELFFLVVGCGLFFWHKKQIFNTRNLALNLFWVTILVSFLVQRGNFHYIPFFYPPLFLLALMGYWKSSLFYPAIISLKILKAQVKDQNFLQNTRSVIFLKMY